MLNKVNLIGNLGADPETRYMKSGEPVCNLSVATSESWKDKRTGEKVTKTEWHRVTFFNPLAEICDRYLKKGSKVYIEGSIHTRKWQDNSGQDRYSTEIKGRELKMLGDNPNNQQQQSQNVQRQPAQPQQSQSNTKGQGNIKAENFTAENFDDDIPF